MTPTNPYPNQPAHTCWQKGFDDGIIGMPLDPPYRNFSHHGGTWGARANRIWAEGWLAGMYGTQERKELLGGLPIPDGTGTCNNCGRETYPADELCNVCGSHIECCDGHDGEE